MIKDKLRNELKDKGNKLLNSNALIFTFLRSAVSSQTAAWLDLVTGFVLFHWAGLSPWLSTAIGAFLGGVVNCVLNYKFTFRADGCPWKAVILKYIMVWVGSMLLNSFGTEAAYYLLNKWTWLETLGFKPAGNYAAARLGVSLIVSWCWNFVLQRTFVYRHTSFDPKAIRFVDHFLPKKLRSAN